jgi:hypothetical protein
MAGTLGAPLAAGAQQVGRMFRVGVLGEEPTATNARGGQRHEPSPTPLATDSHGWIEDANFTFVRRPDR